jgi:hypothetical protein
MRMVVDLPEPFGPRKPKMPPRGMSKLTCHGGEVAEPAGDVAHRDDRVAVRGAHAARPAASLRSTNTSSSDGAIGCTSTEPRRSRARAEPAESQPGGEDPAYVVRQGRAVAGRAADVQGGAEQRHVVDTGDGAQHLLGADAVRSRDRHQRSIEARQQLGRVPTSTRCPLSRKPMREAYSASSM